MNLYKVTFVGTAYVTADSEIGADEKFSAGDWKNQTINVNKIEKVDKMDEDLE